ncbi:MAG TPA: phage gp6-like head-tail connector protein [Clostridiales bacterium]|nr:phage gp6-like head-tail connector protein [Clostridiales bacterium]
MALLDDVKKYMEIDDTGDVDYDVKTDAQITILIEAAKIYLTNAGAIPDDTNKLYCLAVYILVLHWHDNRGVVVIGTITKELEFSLKSIITQLKYCYDDPVVT